MMEIITTFPNVLGVEKGVMGHLSIITRYRKTLKHPLKDQKSGLDEKTYKMLKKAMDYIEKIICSA